MAAQPRQPRPLRRLAAARLLAVAVLVLAPAPAAAQAGPPPTYPIDWAAVPAAGGAAPAKDLAGSCLCDLLNATCTPYCCCDPDCPAGVVAAFQAGAGCLPEGPPQQQLDYCTPAEAFAQVNLPGGDFYRIGKRAAGEALLTQLLCISGDNNPSLGATYPDPPTGETPANAAVTACGASPAAPAPRGAYYFGDALAAAVPLASGATAAGRFSVPQPGVTAACAGGLSEADAATCRLPVPPDDASFRALCLDPLSPLSPLSIAYTQLAANPAAVPAINITIASASLLDAAGALAAAPAGPPAAPAYVPRTVSAPPVCTGVVARADYLIRYAADAATGAAQLASASVDLVLSNVSAADGGARVAVSVSWADAAAPAAALRPLSGAPGYLQGFPLLAGLRAAAGGKVAVARFRGGLALPAGGGGGCDPMGGAHVGFGYNTTSACTALLTAAQLAALCASGDAAAPLRAAGGAALLDAAASGAALVGAWGSSDAANAAEWLPVAVAGWPPPAPAWDAAARRCDGVITGFELRLATGLAASASNPQSKVLHAQLCPTLGSWTADASLAGGAQPYPLRFAARFAAIDQGAPAAALRPAPPLVVPLPPDLFYPFL
ncbi:hypothetical protein Rsub_07983 [Raphidocelis subcapitata]|uniref:Tectonic-1-3 N-terminal domain-containing protein n=1 Tax=Raphidocelis subcapitata TaxID=307507 RepID=A0A2V0P4K1_9CHLO|nr:hypothetical protein Rsub_07983 [Raphidocelis subcapitata]|eukprot:GBF94811.1 hypothetical protein Rsub_07983 [Raphidocelis subcapitata]